LWYCIDIQKESAVKFVKTNVITVGSARFSVLDAGLLRMEYSETGQFEDQTTSLVQNRQLKSTDYEIMTVAGYELVLRTANFTLYYVGGKFDAGSLFIDARSNYGTHYSRWHYGEKVKYNLKGTARTLDKADGAIPLEEGLISKDGFGVIDDSESFLLVGDQVSRREHAEQDMYYFTYGRDFRQTLKMYYELTGFPPMVPRFALGNWWSRYYPYHQDEYLKLMAKFTEQRIPIAVSVLDMNWHTTDIPAKYGSGWTGYTWDKAYFPKPAKMMAKLHATGHKVTLNVHPAAGIRPNEEIYPQVAKALQLDTAKEEPAIFDLQNAAFRKAYFEMVHTPLEKQGVDFWWIDWQQGGQRGAKQVDPLWLLNIAHYQDLKRKRNNDALILSRYAGPGSHRYPIGFSGDTVASWQSLQFQPYFTATASNIGYTWWSHDIGGHMFGSYDGELALRWLQFGVFSPILRMHSSNNIFMGKEPWNYRPDIKQIMIKFLQLRSQLIPYLDSENYRTHTDGTPLIQPLYYGHPEDETAYHFKNEYQFGSAMLVAPITTPMADAAQLGKAKTWLPAGTWYDWFTGIRYQGNRVVTAFRPLAQYPVFVKAGSIVPLSVDYMAPADKLPSQLALKVFGGSDGQYEMVEHTATAIAKTHFDWQNATGKLTITVDDPQHIIPTNRQYTLKSVGMSYDRIESLVSGHGYQMIQPQLTDQKVIVEGELQKKLQFAKIDFSLKQTIWQQYQTQDRAGFISYLTSIDVPNITEMILELMSVK